MNKSIIDILRCPRCSSTKLILNVDKEIGFQILKGKIYCPICQISYQIKEGIPIMLLPDQYEVTKRQQKIDIFDNEKNDEEEIERPHCNGVLYKYLIDSQ